VPMREKRLATGRNSHPMPACVLQWLGTVNIDQ
jgi:hypothetical protein